MYISEIKSQGLSSSKIYIKIRTDMVGKAFLIEFFFFIFFVYLFYYHCGVLGQGYAKCKICEMYIYFPLLYFSGMNLFLVSHFYDKCGRLISISLLNFI